MILENFWTSLLSILDKQHTKLQALVLFLQRTIKIIMVEK